VRAGYGVLGRAGWTCAGWGVRAEYSVLGSAEGGAPAKPELDNTGTISITIRAGRADSNAMKPRIQCVLTPWNPGSMASGSGPIVMINLR
jgi:hypothetical protein